MFLMFRKMIEIKHDQVLLTAVNAGVDREIGHHPVEVLRSVKLLHLLQA